RPAELIRSIAAWIRLSAVCADSIAGKTASMATRLAWHRAIKGFFVTSGRVVRRMWVVDEPVVGGGVSTVDSDDVQYVSVTDSVTLRREVCRASLARLTRILSALIDAPSMSAISS